MRTVALWAKDIDSLVPMGQGNTTLALCCLIQVLPFPHLHRISHLQQILVGRCSGKSPRYWGSWHLGHNDAVGWHIRPGLQQIEPGSPGMCTEAVGEAASPIPALHGPHKPSPSPPPSILSWGTHRGIWSRPHPSLGGTYSWNSQGCWDRRRACHSCVS